MAGFYLDQASVVGDSPRGRIHERRSWPRFPAGTSRETGSTIAAAPLRAHARSPKPGTTAPASRSCFGTFGTANTAISISMGRSRAPGEDQLCRVEPIG